MPHKPIPLQGEAIRGISFYGRALLRVLRALLFKFPFSPAELGGKAALSAFPAYLARKVNRVVSCKGVPGRTTMEGKFL